MSHYYQNDPSLKSNRQTIDFFFAGIRLKLQTDNGVFAKRGIDFGSSLLLKNISIEDPARIIDMGSGYGIIGLFLAKKFPKSQVYLYDINERAIALTKENIRINLINNATAQVSNLFENSAIIADLIVTNPPIRAGKKTVFSLYKQSCDHLTEDGILVVVIQKKQGASSTLKYLKTLFNEVEVVDSDKGYQVIQAKFKKV